MRILLAFFLLAGSAQAQQADPVMLQRAIAVLQQQRNQAMDALVNAEMQRAALAEQVEKLKAEIEQLKKKPE